MITLSRTSVIFGIGALICILFMNCVSVAQDDERGRIANEYYQKGVMAYNEQKWIEAEQYFKKSNETIPNPINDYYLSCVYLKQDKPSEAKFFAQRALDGNPPLEKVYKNGAKDVDNWAEKRFIEKIHESMNQPIERRKGVANRD